MIAPAVAERVPLAPLTTLGVGGEARWFVDGPDEATIRAAHAWARERGVPLRVLGGGSNLLVSDQGVDALVVRVALRGLTTREDGDRLELTAAAGEPWDSVVGTTVEHGWAGLECLSGIPGLVGATPIQNVGAYGQEVSETVTTVRVLDTESGRILTLATRECGFGYRDSRFRSVEPERWVVLAVTYRLRPGGAPAVRYAELARALGVADSDRAPLAAVRAAVLDLRRSKGMVLDPDDPDTRNAGSFFLNPIVDAADAEAVTARADDPAMPRWPQRDGRVKLSAAWLIERTGFSRGDADGAVGLSTRHTLAVVAHEGARARDVVAFAAKLQARVLERFGVRLTPEPVFWGLPALR